MTPTLTPIQTLVLPPEGFPQELYFRGPACAQRPAAAAAAADAPGPAALSIPAGQTVSLDTYFNTFPAFKWAAYTTMADLAVQVTLKGAATVELVGLGRGADAREQVVCARECASDGSAPVRLLACDDVTQLPAFLYLRVRARGGAVQLLRADFLTSAQPRADLNIACCFCTYRREEDIGRNVANLLQGIVHNPASPLHGRLHIYVADNGGTLDPNPWGGEEEVRVFSDCNYYQWRACA